MQHYPREASAAQVPEKIVMRDSLQQKSSETGNKNVAKKKHTGHLGPAAWFILSNPSVQYTQLPRAGIK
jgi:hypothetical protein